MLPEGKYSAWFRTDAAEGMGVIELANGRITGGDTVSSYSGTYAQSGDHFSAHIKTSRHSRGDVVLLGLDEVDIELTGTSKDRTASGNGRVKQIPEAIFKVVLVRMTD
jgi:hypothetical protein